MFKVSQLQEDRHVYFIAYFVSLMCLFTTLKTFMYIEWLKIE